MSMSTTLEWVVYWIILHLMVSYINVLLPRSRWIVHCLLLEVSPSSTLFPGNMRLIMHLPPVLPSTTRAIVHPSVDKVLLLLSWLVLVDPATGAIVPCCAMIVVFHLRQLVVTVHLPLLNGSIVLT